MTDPLHAASCEAFAPELIGRSASLRRTVALADRFAVTPLPILLVGATGTGKELLAHRIHARSGRSGPLVTVNCAALPSEMVESLLFGHKRGAFTGAVHDRVGFVEAARGGTLYLDELSSLRFEAQGKLLRVLESKEVLRLGETEPRRVDFRVIASSQEDLAARVRAGTFRLDLVQRIAGVRLDLLPLRERREDVLPLAEYFAAQEGWTLRPDAPAVLANYDWPGNVRELRTAVERAGFLSASGTVAAATLVEAIELGAFVPAQTERNVEAVNTPADGRAALARLCTTHGCDARRIAAALGWGLSTLYRHLRTEGVSLRLLRDSHRLSGILERQ